MKKNFCSIFFILSSAHGMEPVETDKDACHKASAILSSSQDSKVLDLRESYHRLRESQSTFKEFKSKIARIVGLERVISSCPTFQLPDLHSSLWKIPNLTLDLYDRRDDFLFRLSWGETQIWPNVTTIIIEDPISDLDCTSDKDNILFVAIGGHDGRQYRKSVTRMVERFPHLQKLEIKNYKINPSWSGGCTAFEVVTNFASYFSELRKIDIQLADIYSDKNIESLKELIDKEVNFLPQLEEITITFKGAPDTRISRLLKN